MVGGSVVGGFNKTQFPSLLTNCFCLLFVNESFSKTGLNDSFKIRRYSNAKYGALSIKWLLSFLSICNLDWLPSIMKSCQSAWWSWLNIKDTISDTLSIPKKSLWQAFLFLPRHLGALKLLLLYVWMFYIRKKLYSFCSRLYNHD